MTKTILVSLFVLILAFSSNEAERKANSNASFTIINTLNKADSAYFAKDFDLASNLYENVVFSGGLLDDAALFKFAYSLQRIQNFTRSFRAWSDLIDYKRSNYLNEFAEYFRIKNLKEIDPVRAAQKSRSFIETHKKHALADSLVLWLADFYYDTRQYNLARSYYKLFIEWKIDKSEYPHAAIKSAMSSYYSGKKNQAKDEFPYLLKKYKSDKSSLELADWLEKNEPSFYDEHFFRIIDVYYANGKYQKAKEKPEKFTLQTSNKREKEEARFNLIKSYFLEGQYSSALYGFKNLLNDLSNKNLEPHIRLYISRIYLKKGMKQSAIDAYLDYAQRYPRRRISPEAVWKAGWIAEELNDLYQAIRLYQLVRKKWPNSSYAREAIFREGFSYYRLGNVAQAENIFSLIRYKNWPDIDRNRAIFWVAMCREKNEDFETAKKLRFKLAENLWDDYYTMKSYLMYKSELDTLLQISSGFKSDKNELLSYANGFSNLLDLFETAFEVKDVLGENYALVTLEDIKLVADTREEWIALAEIYKKLGVYGKAYKTYDYINRKFYRDLPFKDKPFILKERFPFFYDNLIFKYANKYSVEPELVWGIMKQESVFEPKAISWANAHGLMQLMSFTAKDMASYTGDKFRGKEQLLDPEYNIKWGIRYLNILMRQFDFRTEHAVAAYNSGAHRVKRWKKLPGSDNVDVFIENVEFSETRTYVRHVMKNYWAYKLFTSNFQIESDQLFLSYSH